MAGVRRRLGVKKDCVLVKYSTDSDDTQNQLDQYEVLNETELADRFGRTNNSFKDIDYVQACVKSKTGVGRPITLIYFAPMPKRHFAGDKHLQILYEFKPLPETSDAEICQKQL
jgi:hypothetical protein